MPMIIYMKPFKSEHIIRWTAMILDTQIIQIKGPFLLQKLQPGIIQFKKMIKLNVVGIMVDCFFAKNAIRICLLSVKIPIILYTRLSFK